MPTNLLVRAHTRKVIITNQATRSVRKFAINTVQNTETHHDTERKPHNLHPGFECCTVSKQALLLTLRSDMVSLNYTGVGKLHQYKAIAGNIKHQK